MHLVGWSMGGGVVLQYLTDHPAGHRAASVTLVAPVSPFGFGGTRGTEGTLCDPAGAGSGGGGVNPGFVARLSAGDRSADSPASPRQVLLARYMKPAEISSPINSAYALSAAIRACRCASMRSAADGSRTCARADGSTDCCSEDRSVCGRRPAPSSTGDREASMPMAGL